MKTKKHVDSDIIQEEYITNLQVGGGFKDSCLGTFIYPLKVGEKQRFPILKQKTNSAKTWRAIRPFFFLEKLRLNYPFMDMENCGNQ